MGTLLNDLKYAVRMLVKAPAFALFCVSVVALGIAANTSIFSFANTVLLRPLPVSRPRPPSNGLGRRIVHRLSDEHARAWKFLRLERTESRVR